MPQFSYYRKNRRLLASAQPRPGLDPAEPKAGEPIFFLYDGDPVSGRGSFKADCLGQLAAPDGLTVLDASRLPDFPAEDALSSALAAGSLAAVNAARPGWERCLEPPAWLAPGKKRVNILAIGDVGATMLMGLTLLGGDVISSIGICDLSEALTARWEFEMGQVSLPWDYDAFPTVEIVTPERLFDCDVFVFAASKSIPPVGSAVKDVRMAQFESNAAIAGHYARLARAAGFRGLWAQVSDPVDPLAKAAYLESNRDENGNWDGLGLLPEQIQGCGLGVMNARAAYYARKDPRLGQFLTDGRTYGPHGEGLWAANSLSQYDEALSAELTDRALHANLKMRELGFKPYAAPALSSGALTLLLTLRGEWHCGSVYLDGVYLGCKLRHTPLGVETELLDSMPDPLFAHIREAAERLRGII